jgi:hypothetical protein
MSKSTTARVQNALWFRILIPVLCLVIAVFFIFFPPQRLGILDDTADAYFNDSVVKATVAYGSTRLINAGVSVVKESTLQLEPGGVGVAVAVGQVADPLDDLTERLSSVLVTSIVSLTVQKISYEIAQVFVFQLLGILLFIIALLSVFRKSPLALSFRNMLMKVGVFLFVVRLFLPCSAFLSNHLNQELFFPRIQEQQEKISPMLEEFEKLTSFEVPEVKGIGDIFSVPMKMVGDKTTQLNLSLTLLAVNGVAIFSSLLEIMALYVGIFVIQVLFLPLLMFWLLNKLLFVLFSHRFPIGEVRFKPAESTN